MIKALLTLLHLPETEKKKNPTPSLPKARINPKRPNKSVSVLMKVEIEEALITKIKNTSDCYGMSKDEIKEYLTELVDELIREHLSKTALGEDQAEDYDQD